MLLPALLVWIALPSLFRTGILIKWLGTHVLGLGLLDLFIGLGLGLLQDAFIALQALGVMLLIRRLLPGRSTWMWVGGALLTLFTTYYLFDFLLFWNIDLRMNASFLQFIRDADSFVDSANDVGIGWLVGFILLFVSAIVYAFRKSQPRFDALQLSPAVALLALGVSGGAVASVLIAPGELMYRANNVILTDEIEGIYALLGIEDPLLELAKETDGSIVIPEPAGERFSYVDPKNYPILKETQGFTGNKRFDIRVEPEERPHVVILVMESFRALDIGAYGSTLGASPHFDALAKQGLFFTHFYATGIQTTRAVVSVLHGILPRFSRFTVQAHLSDLPLIGLAEIFKEQGYHTGYLFNGELDFEHMETFFEHRAYDDVYGERDMEEAFPGAARFSWGVHDEYLMDFGLDWLEEQDKAGQSAFATMFTITTHHPWETPPHHREPEFEVGDEIHARFIQSFHYSDACLGRFVKGLRERGLAEKTILIITADTSQAMGEHNNWSVTRNLYEENVKIPLLILADGRITPQTVEGVGSQTDVLPTLLDVLGWGGLNHATGSSLMRTDAEHMAFFQSPYALQYWGLRHQQYKYFYVLKSDTHHLYDLSTDPGEQNNIADEHPARVQRYQLEIARRHRLFESLYEDRAFTP